MCGSEQYDAAYERISMLFNAGLWYMKHSLKFAGLEEYASTAAYLLYICISLTFSHFICVISKKWLFYSRYYNVM